MAITKTFHVTAPQDSRKPFVHQELWHFPLCAIVTLQSCSKIDGITPTKKQESFFFFPAHQLIKITSLIEKGLQDWHMGNGSGVEMSYLRLEVAGLLLAASFSICQTTPCGEPHEISQKIKTFVDVKRVQSCCFQLPLHSLHAHLALQRSVLVFCQQNNIQDKKVTRSGVGTGEAGGVPGLQDVRKEAEKKAASCQVNSEVS